jgi:hypothetical protein
MQEAISFSTDIENQIRIKLSEIFTLLSEDSSRLDGSVAINSWGDSYDSKDTFQALSGFLDAIAFDKRKKEYIILTYLRENEEGDFSWKVRDTIADILELCLRDSSLVAIVRGWKNNLTDKDVVKGLSDWYDLNGKTLLLIRA